MSDVSEKGSDFISDLGDAARQNPLSAALIGMGVLWLFTGGRTVERAGEFVRRRFDLPPAEQRLFQVDSESRILGHCHWQPGKRRDAPVIVILHGLEGSSESNYVFGIAEKAMLRGFHAVRQRS